MTPSLTKQVLAMIGDEPITSKEVAEKLGIPPRACRSRMSLLQKRGDIIYIDSVRNRNDGNGLTKRYVKAGSTKSLPLDTLLCHASNEWLKHA